MPTAEELQSQADAMRWFHSIDLGQGVVTKGASVIAIPEDGFPDVTGRSVLDIGAWDGYYSFRAERLGARRTVALDHYAWGVDIAARGAYWAECIAEGTLADQSRDLTDFWLPDLPGRRPFEFAATTLGSKVETLAADFASMDLDAIGRFDVAFYLGVLYHMKEPLTCLERLRSVTTEVAVIETEAVHLQHFEHESLMQFFSGGDLQTDFGNWYVPTMKGLHALCRAAGFSDVRTIQGPPEPPTPEPESLATRIARRLGHIERRDHLSAPSTRYRAIVHARP
jgi:tRNA (mo5U34)-methyltransferase